MTKKRPTPHNDSTNQLDEDACRRLMVLLCGGEEEAAAMGSALLRSATPDEEELIKQHYEESRRVAHDSGKELNIALHPKLAKQQHNQGVVPSLSETEEKEFDSFMEEIYRRAEARERDQQQSSDKPETTRVLPLVRKTHAGARSKQSKNYEGGLIDLPLAASSTVSNDQKDRSLTKLGEIWINGKQHGLFMETRGRRIYVSPTTPSYTAVFLLGERFELRKTDDDLYFEVVELKHGDVIDVIDAHGERDQSARAE